MIIFEIKKQNQIKVIICFFMACFFFSCSMERKLAQKYINSNDTIHLLIIQTKEVTLKNLKLPVDSISKKETVVSSGNAILDSLKKDVFLNIVNVGLVDELKKRNFKIYTESDTADFMKLDSGYIFNISQIEIEEFDTPDTLFVQRDTALYYKAFLLNSIKIKWWIEVSQIMSNDVVDHVLYNTATYTDEIKTDYKEYFFSDQVNLVYDINKITMNRFYNEVYSFGMLNAAYINDYFMNKYIFDRYYKKKKPLYFHFDSSQNHLSPAGYNRFIFM